MSDWRGFSDTRRGLLRVSGADARPFLQGLITNDVDRLETGGSIYAAMLSAQGKYQFDFHLFDASALVQDALILDIASDRLESLAKRLNMYRLRRDVEIADASAEYGVALAWNGVFENFGMCGANTIISPDSRSPELGVRIIAPTPDQALKAMGAAPASPAEYDALRVALGVPESGAELVADASYILENRFEALNGVDFKKGCYVGQEVTARMKHKTELRKGLVRVAIEGHAPAPGTDITVDGKPAGTLFTSSGGSGLAHVRLDRARAGQMQAGAAKISIID